MRNIILIVILFFGISVYAGEKTGNLNIYIEGFRNNKGSARVLLFSEREKDYFPSNHEKAYSAFVIEIKDKKANINIDNLPYGIYAVTVHHDEDNSGKINTGLMGIPRDGIGISNNIRTRFGPPSFEKASIEILENDMKIKIEMRYR